MIDSLGKVATTVRPVAARFIRVIPNIRGRGRIASLVNKIFLRAGAEPIVECEMIAGHKLKVDCRIFSHGHAYFSGMYDNSKISMLLAFLTSGGLALDVGANIGFYAVPMALAAKRRGGHLVAVEPLSQNEIWLRANLVLNSCDDAVTVLPIGLGERSGETEIVLAEDFLSGAEVGNAVIADGVIYSSQFRRQTITLDTLDHIWSRIGGRLDIVKVDIEGYEHKFLSGGRATIGAHRPLILMEVNRGHYQLRGLQFDTIIPSLLPESYAFAEIRSDGSVTWLDTLAHCRDTDVFLVPTERCYMLVRARRTLT